MAHPLSFAHQTPGGVIFLSLDDGLAHRDPQVARDMRILLWDALNASMEMVRFRENMIDSMHQQQ